LILWNATINRLFLRGDGSNDFLRDATLNLPLPGTTPTFFWLEFSQVSWTANDALFCTGTTGGQMQCFQHTSSPTMAAYNNVIAADNNGASLGTATRGEVYYSNSTSDYTKLASTTVTGVSFGNQDPPAGINLLATSTGASAMNADLYTLNIHSALPSVAERAALTAASAARGFAA
jgi:hypothetical protein